jgi:hypothetical protein
MIIVQTIIDIGCVNIINQKKNKNVIGLNRQKSHGIDHQLNTDDDLVFELHDLIRNIDLLETLRLYMIHGSFIQSVSAFAQPRGYEHKKILRVLINVFLYNILDVYI